ncbi:hypothetical protein [Gimesia maris]|uniref:hypothetical protein n=1 Tax=Gimesia maris TaxID=122 RepID=UPI0032EDF944|tara:strand:- start:512 stop:1153 length:642 start_codon:yes stop_codon:yes gene_type:complete
MTAKESFWTVLLSCVTFAILGGLASLWISIIFPNYYDSVFFSGRAARIDPFIGGIRLGATQGTGVGLLLALGVLAWVALRDHSQTTAETTPEQKLSHPPTSRSWIPILSWISATLILTVICSTIAFVMGALIEELRSTQRQTTENIERLESLLASGNYPDLKTDYSSAAQVYLVGTVPNKSTRQKLLEQVVSTFGTQEAEMMIRYVEVNTASP